MAERTAEPFWRAWREVLPGRVEPERLERLSRDRSKRQIYRIQGAGHGGSAVIAKLCPPREGSTERTIYEKVLPHLPLTSPRYYGTVDAGDEGYWILLEDVSAAKFSPLVEEHRALAAPWLAVLHSRAPAIAPLPSLPARGPAHYLHCLRSGRERILSSLENPAFADGDAALLEAIVRQYDGIESQWPRLEKLCGGMPVTLVHGDFRPKNVYVRSDGGETRLFPTDWETAGWGVPAVDLAAARVHPFAPLVDLAAYEDLVRSHWPWLDGAAIGRQVRLGVVFRRLAAVDWASLSLATPFPQKAVMCLHVYHFELGEVLRDPPWAE